MLKSPYMDRVKFEGPATYRIVVRAFLDARMSDSLAGMRITSESRGVEHPLLNAPRDLVGGGSERSRNNE